MNMTACRLGLLVSLLGLMGPGRSTAREPGAPADSGFSYSLFDGKSLGGWTIENDCRVEVRGDTLRLVDGNGWLRSDHRYGDFLLHVEWRALKQSGFDAGIYIRTLPGGKPFPKRGYQLNLLEGKVGVIGNLPGAVPPDGLLEPPGEWNRFDVMVVGSTVSLAINGHRAYQVDGLEIAAGHVGIQVEVPKGGEFEVRNVRVTELGYRSLFNGRDLSGWEGAGQPASLCWRVVPVAAGPEHSEFWTRALARFRAAGGRVASSSSTTLPGVLECTGRKGPWLRTNAEFGDFNLRLEYQVSAGGNSGVYVRVPADGNHHRSNEQQPPAGFEVQVLDDHAKKYAKLKDYQYGGSLYAIAPATSHVCRPAGEWNTLEINCRGRQVTTIHNGVVIVDATPEKFPILGLRNVHGFLGLQNHSTVVRFRRLRIGGSVAGSR